MDQEHSASFVVLIPAFRPTLTLLEVVRELAGRNPTPIVVVDDGSGVEYADIFARVAEIPNVQVVRHAVNLGKGAALKTGMNFAVCTFPDLVGIVTADADGQHLPGDIERVGRRLLEEPESLVLGSRRFDGPVPFRSRFGNVVTRHAVRALVGHNLTDTQTGLRGIPLRMIPWLLRIDARGYEFEFEMLILARRMPVRIVEETISTVYEPGNPSSHFNPLIDSAKIYFVLLRFSSVSLLTAVLDNVVFYLAFRQSHLILASQIIGRIAAVAFNYVMVRRAVFASTEKHRALLPRFLLLVLVSGSISYSGIRLLSSRLGMNPMAAKILVESLLFFVNFVIQRVFIFSNEIAPEGRGEERQGPSALLPLAVLAGVVGVEIWGFATTRPLAQFVWTDIGLTRLTHFTAAYGAAAVIVLLLAPRWFPLVTLSVVGVLTVMAIGIVPPLATIFVLISAEALGIRLLAQPDAEDLENRVLSILLGLGVYVFVMAWLVRVRVNYPALYATALALPILGDVRGVSRRLAASLAAVQGANLERWSERGACALLVYVLSMHWLLVLKPEISADGLAMHLAIPADVATHHVMTFEPSRWVWAVMPIGADYSYTIAYMLGGESAARLLNFAMLLSVEALLYCTVRRWIEPAFAFLLIASFASSPLSGLVTSSLFVENQVAAMVLGAVVAAWHFGRSGDRRFLLLVSILGGTAVATKLGGVSFLVCMLPFVAFEVSRHKRALGRWPALYCTVAGCLLCAFAAPPYLIAWWKTHNPLFPFLNERFRSPLFDPIDFKDLRYAEPVTWKTLFDLTFHTNRWYEGQNGSFGFQYLTLALLAIIATAMLRSASSMAATTMFFAGGILVLRSVPNARYLYPALAFVFVPVAELLGAVSSRVLRGAVALCLVGFTTINAYAFPLASWYDKSFFVPFSSGAREDYLRDSAPVRQVIAHFNHAHAGTGVLMASGTSVAELSGDVYENAWHQWNVSRQIKGAETATALHRLIDLWGVRYVIAPSLAAGVELTPTLANLLADCAVPEFEAGRYYLARFETTCGVLPGKDASDRLVVGPGAYDDFDAAVVTRGSWTRVGQYHGACDGTLTSTSATGAGVSFAFSGSRVTYAFVSGPDGGAVALNMDGVELGKIDLYGATRAATRLRSAPLPRRQHLLLLRSVTGVNGRNGREVNVDCFEVE